MDRLAGLPKFSRQVDLSLVEQRTSPVVWTLLWFLAAATRLSAALILPNAEQDGYSYAESIANFTERIAAGNLQWSDLFGFWLPSFPLASAIPNLWIHDPILAGKLLNALCGTATCVFVFGLTKELTRSSVFAWFAFALILFNPFHILYSAACMTDVPHACMVLASLWFVFRKQWVAAAIFAALAESLRLEAWALLFVLPAIQLMWERRVSIIAFAILLLPPLGWLLINYFATGDPFTYFADRVRYHAAYMEFHPTRQGFVLADIQQDLSYLLLGANWMVFFGCAIAFFVLIWQAVRRTDRFSWPCFATGLYGSALTGFLLLAYVTKRQPVFLPRYGLILFVVGLPLFMWLVQFVIQQSKQRRAVMLIAVLIVAFSIREIDRQWPTILKVIGDFHAHEQIAHTVDSALFANKRSFRCFSDDVAIRVLSRQPPERFLRSQTVPASAARSPDDFEQYLRDQNVSHLVFVRTEDSLPVKFYGQLGRSEDADTGKFELVRVARSSFGPDLWLYRLRDEKQ